MLVMILFLLYARIQNKYLKKMNRLTFLFLLSVMLGSAVVKYSKAQQIIRTNPNPQVKFEVGVASYAFREKGLDEVLEVMEGLDIHRLTVKSMHVPLDISTKKAEAVLQKAKARDIDIYAGGVIYMDSREKVEQAFEYADRAGMELIVGVPDPELMDWCEQLVKKYDIQLAIHIHGDWDILYPSPESAYEMVKGRDPRIGICMDVGHTLRINRNPAEEIRQYGSRVLDIQFWDVSSASPEGKVILPGYGVLDFESVLQALIDIDYTGTVSIEYWSDPQRPELGTAYTLGYIYSTLEHLSYPGDYSDNRLTDKEKEAGWQLLFNGADTRHWRGINKDHFPDIGWKIEDGALCVDACGGAESSHGGDIVTRKVYGDFILKWEWKMKDRGGNSGVKYVVQEGRSENEKYGYGLEYQILDDANHSWMKQGKLKPGDYYTVGGLYNLYPPVNKKLKPLGTYNQSKIIVKGDHVEHWLNGLKVLEYSRGSQEFEKRVSQSKFKDIENFGQDEKGHILLQDHGNQVCFKNIKVKTLSK